MWDYFSYRKDQIQGLREAQDYERCSIDRREHSRGLCEAHVSDNYVKEWVVIKSVQGNSILRLEYGDVQATVGIMQQPNMFSFYEVTWEVINKYADLGYSGRTCIDQYQLVRLQRNGTRITDEIIVKLLEPAADMARIAMFACVVEKLI